MRSGIGRRRLLHGAAAAGVAWAWRAARPRPGRRRRARGHGRRGDRVPGVAAGRRPAARVLHLRRQGAPQLGLRPAPARGAALQGHVGGGPGRRARADEGQPERGRLRQGRERHPARGRAAPARDVRRADARSRELLGDRLRRPGTGGAVGLAARGPSSLAELHAGAGQAHRRHAGLLRRQSGRGARGRAQGPAHAGARAGPRPRARPGDGRGAAPPHADRRRSRWATSSPARLAATASPRPRAFRLPTSARRSASCC